MAKQSDRLAPTAQSEKGGSPLTGLFAEENEFDRRTLWRIGSWGAAAVGAVTLAVVSNQWSLGLRREQLAAADLTRQSQQIQSLAKESQTETRRLASAIETLNSDRDRLFSRVTVIEQGLDSVTGALAKQTPPAAVPPAAPQASAAPQGSSAGSSQAALTTPAPVPAPVATTAVNSAAPDKPRANVGKSAASAANAGPAGTATTSPPQMSAAAGASLMARSMMSPPDPAAPKPIEAAKSVDPELSDAKPAGGQPADARTSDAKAADTKAADTKTAEAKIDGKTDGKTAGKADAKEPETAPTATSEVVASANAMDGSETEAAGVAAKRTDFAVELGSANSLGGLRALWRGLRHLNGELGALNPIIVIKEARTGFGMQLHLAAGPLKDAAAAAKICAVLAEARRPCETTVYDGQRLTMKADATPTPPASRPTSEAKSEANSPTRPDPRAEGKTEARPEGKLDARPGSSKRSWSRHSRKEEPPPPPPPAPAPEPPSTLSSLFGRK